MKMEGLLTVWLVVLWLAMLAWGIWLLATFGRDIDRAVDRVAWHSVCESRRAIREQHGQKW